MMVRMRCLDWTPLTSSEIKLIGKNPFQNYPIVTER